MKNLLMYYVYMGIVISPAVGYDIFCSFIETGYGVRVLANYIVFDMEWNQPLSRGRVYRTEDFALYGEIIQIGAVKLDENLEMVDKFDIIIRPHIYTKMKREIQELTSITDKDLESGVSFANAAAKFAAWCGEDSVLLSWGESDIDMLEDNCILHDMDYDWIPEWFDAQLMFDDQITQEDRRFSLDYACYMLNITGTQAHDALHDALATAEVMKHLKVAEWIEEDRRYRG